MDSSQRVNQQQADDHDTRVSQEVSSLSTKLIEAIDKQSALETSNQILKRQNASLYQQLQTHTETKQLYDKVLEENTSIRLQLEKSLKLKNNAEAEISKLRVEIEDLSESLFDEANKMVKEARVETDNYKIKNSKLNEELTEKSITIESLSNELKILKDLLYEMEQGNQGVKKSIVSTPNPSTDSLASDSNYEDAVSLTQRDHTTVASQSTMFASSKLSPYDTQIIYSPIYNSLRFDLINFQDFVRFVKFLYSRNNNKSPGIIPVDHAILRETAFFKKLFKDEVEPALAIETAPGISYFNRKTFVGALVEGRVIIEPISGVNESYKLNHKKADVMEAQSDKMFSFPKNSPPVATLTPCSICGEDRNDILEHSRLYTLKLYSKKPNNSGQHPPSSPASGTTAPNESPSMSRSALEVSHQYSLCNYCLIKFRHICELFAFIRNINNAAKTKVWNFDSNTEPKEDVDLECIKAWFQMTKIRAKIFWARVGIWDINEYAPPSVHTSSSASTVPNTPNNRSESELGFRGSVIGTGIIAGNRQSFMDSVNIGNNNPVTMAKRPEYISSAKNSPIIPSPLNNQVKGYFDNEVSAANTEIMMESPLGDEEEVSIAASSVTVKTTQEDSNLKEDNDQTQGTDGFDTSNILDDYTNQSKDDEEDNEEQERQQEENEVEAEEDDEDQAGSGTAGTGVSQAADSAPKDEPPNRFSEEESSEVQEAVISAPVAPNDASDIVNDAESNSSSEHNRSKKSEGTDESDSGEFDDAEEQVVEEL